MEDERLHCTGRERERERERERRERAERERGEREEREREREKTVLRSGRLSHEQVCAVTAKQRALQGDESAVFVVLARVRMCAHMRLSKFVRDWVQRTQSFLLH